MCWGALDCARDFADTPAAFADEHLECHGFLLGAEVLSLQVLDEREEVGFGCVFVTLDRGNLGPAQQSCGLQAAVARDELVVIPDRPHDHRLE